LTQQPSNSGARQRAVKKSFISRRSLAVRFGCGVGLAPGEEFFRRRLGASFSCFPGEGDGARSPTIDGEEEVKINGAAATASSVEQEKSHAVRRRRPRRPHCATFSSRVRFRRGGTLHVRGCRKENAAGSSSSLRRSGRFFCGGRRGHRPMRPNVRLRNRQRRRWKHPDECRQVASSPDLIIFGLPFCRTVAPRQILTRSTRSDLSPLQDEG